MTVLSTTNRMDYTGNDVNKTFAFTFKVFEASDLYVYVDGVLQALDIDYTIPGSFPMVGGNVVFYAAPGSGLLVLLIRILPLLQISDYTEGDKFPAETHEDNLDKIIMIAQQFEEAIGRELKVPVTSSLTEVEVEEGASKFLRWNAAGDAIVADIGNTTGAHHESHESGGGDPLSGSLNVKLDDLAIPDDNTDLDATVSKHGLFPKLLDNTDFDVSITKHGLVPKAPNDATKVLRGGATPAWGYDKIVQVVNVEIVTSTTGTTAIPNDDTIPQNTEGNEYMTLAITPKNINNKLKIDVVIHLSHSSTANLFTAALFQDSIVDALAASCQFIQEATSIIAITFTHYMTAGTISNTTFKVRAGSQVGTTTTFNGSGGSRKMGGVLISSITITEIAA